MTPEDIARRFERRQGYELIDYAPVVLPLYRLTVDAVTMVHRDIPPIKEFVMRAIYAGLMNSEEIAGFLGLELSIVSATIDQLEGDRYINIHEDVPELTKSGLDVLNGLRESSPQDETLVFLYDRLLLKPVRLPADQTIVPRNVDLQQMIEIRPYPAEGPDVQEIAISDLQNVLEEQAGGRSAFHRDLLCLKRIVRRIRFYRPGMALVYKKVKSSEIQIAFVVDDMRDEALEHAFAERGGPKKMGFVKAIDESSTAAELRRYLGSEVQRLLPDSASLDEKRLALSLARLKYQASIGRVERRGDARTPEDLAAIENAELAMEEAKSQLQKLPARPIAPYEHRELLEEALEQCQSKLCVSSKTIDRMYVDSVFLKKLEAALKRGVDVVIAISDEVKEGRAIDIERLRRNYPKLDVRYIKKSSFYYISCDHRFVAVSNRPFLGNIRKVRSFSHVVGCVLQEQELVSAFLQKVQKDGCGGKGGWGHANGQQK